MIKNAIATPKPAVTLRTIDECASVGLIVILPQTYRTRRRCRMVPLVPHQTRNAKAESGRTCHAPQRSKEFRKNRTKSSFLGTHDCRAPLRSHSLHLHDPALIRVRSLIQKQALESIDRRNLFSKAFARHYSALRVYRVSS